MGREFLAVGDGFGKADIKVGGLTYTLDLGGARLEGLFRVRVVSPSEGRVIPC